MMRADLEDSPDGSYSKVGAGPAAVIAQALRLNETADEAKPYRAAMLRDARTLLAPNKKCGPCFAERFKISICQRAQLSSATNKRHAMLLWVCMLREPPPLPTLLYDRMGNGSDVVQMPWTIR